MTSINNTKLRQFSPRPNARKNANIHAGPAVPTDPFASCALPTDQILVGDCIEQMKRLPDRCIDLVILDPPYWKVVGEKWDYRWRTEEDYRKWCLSWFKQVERVCKRSASVYLFGYIRNLVHLFHDITSLGFEFRQEITVDKGIQCVAGRKTSTYKMFPNTTETVFFFVYNAKPMIRDCLKHRASELGLAAKDINDRLGAKSNGGGVWSLYTGQNILAQVPTPEMWERLEDVLEFEAPEDLKGFHFEPQMGLTNVWNDIDFYSESRIHRTQKPLKLIERLIQASSRTGAIVLDPFAGSGSTAIVSKALDRECISIEIDPAMAQKAEERIANHEYQPELFGD